MFFFTQWSRNTLSFWLDDSILHIYIHVCVKRRKKGEKEAKQQKPRLRPCQNFVETKHCSLYPVFLSDLSVRLVGRRPPAADGLGAWAASQRLAASSNQAIERVPLLCHQQAPQSDFLLALAFVPAPPQSMPLPASIDRAAF